MQHHDEFITAWALRLWFFCTGEPRSMNIAFPPSLTEFNGLLAAF